MQTATTTTPAVKYFTASVDLPYLNDEQGSTGTEHTFYQESFDNETAAKAHFDTLKPLFVALNKRRSDFRFDDYFDLIESRQTLAFTLTVPKNGMYTERVETFVYGFCPYNPRAKCPLKIETRADAEEFAKFIGADLGAGFHPDDCFIEYHDKNGPVYSLPEAYLLEDLLESVMVLLEREDIEPYAFFGRIIHPSGNWE